MGIRSSLLGRIYQSERRSTRPWRLGPLAGIALLWNNPCVPVLAFVVALNLVLPAPGGPLLQAGSAPGSQTTADGGAYYYYLLGRHLEGTGDYDGAVRAFERAAELDPDSAVVLAELAALHSRRHRIREAIETANRALSNDPDSSEAHLVLGTVYATLVARQSDRSASVDEEHAGRAIRHFEKALTRISPANDPSAFIILGRLYVHTGRLDEAASVFGRFGPEDPGYGEARLLLAEAYSDAGRVDAAIDVLSEAAAMEPGLYLALAQMYEQAGRWREAADSYGRAVADQPDSVELKGRWAYALLSSGSPGASLRAGELLKEVLAANPNDSFALYLLSRVQREAGDLEGAEASARRILALNPKAVAGVHALVQVLESKREYRQIVELLEPVVSSAAAPEGSDLGLFLVHLGFAHQEIGEHDRAIAVFARATEIAPEDPSNHVYLAQAYLAAQKFEQALQLATEAQARHPEELRLVRLRAEALRELGRDEDGIRLVEEAVRGRAEEPVAARVLAEVYISTRRFEKAQTVLERVIASAPDDTSLIFQLGAVFERQEKHREAEEQFQRVLALDPMHAPALNYLGYMLAERGERLEESVEYIKRALEMDPHNGAYLDSLGWAYFKLDRLDLAEPNLRKAAEQLPRDSVVQDHFGDLLYRLGRLEEAIAAWERALAGDQESIEVADIEKKIRLARDKLGRR
jgi:tetratricopeptide (TPR) repeat protein